MIRLFLITFSVFIITTHLFAQSGTLDPTFGQNGKVITNIDQTRNIATSMLIQPDGKIVVGGYCTPVDYNAYFTLVRYNTDGTLDNSFGNAGIVRPPVGINEDIPYSIVLQSDGKIIAAGYSWNGANYDFAMVRYNSNGSRDLGFGTGGVVTTDFNNTNEKANKVLLQPDGKIIMCGISDISFDVNVAFARYLPNGTLDNTFGSSGKVSFNIGESGSWQSIRSAELQNDGKILATGFTEVYIDKETGNYDYRFVLLRLNSNGDLDNGFGNSGIVQTLVKKHDIGLSLAVQADNKILLLGQANPWYNGFDDFALVRYNSDGSIDNTFGNNGIVLTTFDNTDDIPASMVLQSDQKILAFGFTARNNGTTLDFALARYNTDGTLDNTFGIGGKVMTDFGGNWDFGTSMALQKNGKIVVAGYTKNGNDYDFALARYNNDVVLPVELISFTAEAVERNVQLEWKTASEENSNSFEVQRSHNGKQWFTIGSVQSAGNSKAESDYSFIDNAAAEGRNLYRLKMIDQDRTFTYSRIQNVDVEISGSSFSVYPNPSQEKIYIEAADRNLIKNIALLSTVGKQVFKSDLPVSEIEIRHLQAGLYTLFITKQDGSGSRHQIVKK
ncbi:T9SS type A sorting domain-containing protein [Dyadobacter flavalbus]|uniref:T9SS type A sorting domain-containing protein n=1 Tax=Dyadobacter flavalbus TaxID=2579942 RepID=A0A5M8QXB7_9BACT|nr:T9SS type A sorting domain-containing protein [Dyadobacter flavalbus]KAA6439414.1 T9SS type A sorting domain-containing protein [Dyadobacter flavalbus]